MAEDLHVEQGRHASLEALLLAHVLPVLGDLEHELEIDAGVVRGLLERRDDHLACGLAVAEGQSDHGGVDDVGARLGGLEVVHRSHAADVVAVDVDRESDLLLERADHLLGAERREHARPCP